MAYGDTYNIGTATLDSNNPKIVHVAGALLLSNAVKGDTFEYAGRRMSIASVPANGSFSMDLAWPDAPFTDVAYVIIQDSPSRNPPMAQARTQRDLLERLRIFDQAKPTFGIREFGVNAPPLDYAAGDMLVIGSAPTSIFASKINAVARFTEEGGWNILTPEFGWHIISQTDPTGSNIVRTFDGTSWTATTAGGLNPLGAYSGATTYKLGDLVTHQDSSWIYRNGTPSAGNAPPTLPAVSNAYWQLNAKVGPQDATPPLHLQCNSDPWPTIPHKPTIYAKWSSLQWLDTGSNFASPSGNKAYLNKNGIIQYAAAGVPRFHTIWMSGESGLLLEPARTNIALQSQTLDQSPWNRDNLITTVNAGIAPDGTATADLLVETTANVSHRLFQSISKAATATAYAYSIYVKSAGRPTGYILLYDGTSSAQFLFDLTAKTITTPAANAFTNLSSTIEELPNGWFRLVTNFTTPATTNISVLNYLGGGNYAGDGVSGQYLWGAQLEAGPDVTSYIVTTAASVARAADALSFPITNANPLEGTIYCRMANFRSPAPLNAADVNIGFGNSSAAFGSDAYISRNAVAVSFGPGAAPVNISSSIGGSPLNFKAAARLTANDGRLAVNGVLGGVDAACAMPPSINRLGVGSQPWTASNQPYGVYQEIAYWPRALTDAQILTVTS